MLTPLIFAPLYRRYIWGGRRFAGALGRPLPPGDDYAESWELVDRGADQSVVAAGPLAGETLGRLVRETATSCWDVTRRAGHFRCSSSFSTPAATCRCRRCHYLPMSR